MNEATKTASIVLADDAATVADIVSAIGAASVANGKVEIRLAEISSKKEAGIIKGPVRRRLAEAGDVAGLVELDKAEAALKAEQESLKAQLDALRRKRQQAQAAEAAKNMPATMAEIEAALDREEAALSTLRAARAETDRLALEAHQLRGTVRSYGHAHQLGSGDRGMVQRFITARGLNTGDTLDARKIEKFSEAIGIG
ncbi:MAG: hypothetical protein LBV29_02565 [Azoarcus sp.]|nr:hypothetical protein [Azoarcus sp.]